MKKAIYGLAGFALIAGAIFAFMQYQEIQRLQAALATASEELVRKNVELDEKRSSIEDVIAVNNGLQQENTGLAASVLALQEEIKSRRCQSVDRAQFDNDVFFGTSYVVTPAKMGWNGSWSIRENLVLERDYGLARAYEFRIDLTPADNTDFWQEIHTTVRAYSSPAAAVEAFKAIDESDPYFLKSTLNLGVPINVWRAAEDDGASTMKIQFLCGNYTAEVKTKYLEEVDVALPILEQAAVILFNELSYWVP